MNFDEAFKKLLQFEGGYVDHKYDPGGETNMGISKRSYPDEDIHELTLERAREIYHRDFWVPAQCDNMPDDLRFQLFDFSVHSGVRQAIKCLQRAVGVRDDGVIGPVTMKAVYAMPPSQINARFNGHRLTLLADLKTWPAFSRGWVKRIASNLMEA
jgi:lysozyme family protein